jgi:hypothetical protein
MMMMMMMMMIRIIIIITRSLRKNLEAVPGKHFREGMQGFCEALINVKCNGKFHAR